MPDPTAPNRIQELVARCVSALERGQPDPVPAVCAGDPHLEAAVRDRLRRLRGLGLVGAEPETEEQLDSFGPYEVRRCLGSGGMGTVWLADQKEPVARRVAIKVVKRGMDSAEVLARFAAERQALARLSHAHVARIFDAGTVPDGRPYFAMELVEGVPITVYADRKGLDTDQRLALLLPVCDAVHHAHQRGLIHRDLKPSNILVTERDGTAVPVVIDFGVAKALDSVGGPHTLLTEHGRILGTPEYMSPEQAAGDSADVDTRTDVYSLGVVLYELLTGTLPVDAKQLRSAGVAAARELLCEVDPPTPSARISTLGADGDDVAARRHTTPVALQRRLRGELDWIVLATLRKERGRRYDSVAALADDLRRHLRGDSVAAAPPSRAYLLRKSLRRHRVAFAIAGTLAVGAIIAFIGIAVGWSEARAQARLAELNLGDALDTVDGLLVKASRLRLEGVPRATEIEVSLRRDALAALQRLLGRRPDSADLRARVAIATFDLADGVRLLDESDEAFELAERARARLSELVSEGAGDPAVATALGKSLRLLGDLHERAGEIQMALDVSSEALQTFEDLHARFPNEVLYERLVASQLTRHGSLLSKWGDQVGFADHVEHALELREELLAREPDRDEHRQALLQSLQLVSMVRMQRGDHGGAAELQNRQIALAEEIVERDPSRDKRQSLAASLTAVAAYDHDRGDVALARERWRRAIEVYGALTRDYPHVAYYSHLLAQPEYFLAASLSDEWPERPVLVTRVIELTREAAEDNRRALADDGSSRPYLAWQRQILQLYGVALRCSEDPPAGEIERVQTELAELPSSSGADHHLRRARANAAALRKARR